MASKRYPSVKPERHDVNGTKIADSTRRDTMIRQAVGAYGKKGGKYIDPQKLLQSLPRV